MTKTINVNLKTTPTPMPAGVASFAFYRFTLNRAGAPSGSVVDSKVPAAIYLNAVPGNYTLTCTAMDDKGFPFGAAVELPFTLVDDAAIGMYAAPTGLSVTFS